MAPDPVPVPSEVRSGHPSPDSALGPPEGRPDSAGHGTNSAGLLYGAVVAAATLILTDDHPDGTPGSSSWVEVWENVLAVVLTLGSYYAVHVYTRVLSERGRGGTSTARIRSALHHETAVLVGGLPATAIYVVVAALQPEQAGAWAMRATAVMLGVFTWVLARRAGVRGPLLVVEIVGVALLGVVMIALKAALH